MQELSEEFIAKQRAYANEAAEAYIQSLYSLLQCIDLSQEGNAGKAHGILNMIQEIQQTHSALDNPTSTHAERSEAFTRKR
jgi:hypothetical protein